MMVGRVCRHARHWRMVARIGSTHRLNFSPFQGGWGLEVKGHLQSCSCIQRFWLSLYTCSLLNECTKGHGIPCKSTFLMAQSFFSIIHNVVSKNTLKGHDVVLNMKWKNVTGWLKPSKRWILYISIEFDSFHNAKICENCTIIQRRSDF